MAKPSPVPYEEVEHTADVSLRVWGADLAELFANAARGMFHLMSNEQPEGSVQQTVRLEAPDTETLLVDWLNELLYLAETHKVIFHHFHFLEFHPTSLHAQVYGGKAKARKAIKAATFSNLAIEQSERGHTVTIVFDV